MSVSLAGAITLLLATSLGALGVGLIFVLGISLNAARQLTDSAFGSGSYTVFGSTPAGSNIDGDVTLAVVVCILTLVLATALAWGAISLLTGTTSRTAMVSLVVTAAVLFLGVIDIHPLLLIVLVLPVVAIIGLLSPTSRAYLGSRATG